MKRFIILMSLAVMTFGVIAQNVGIGTTTPAGRLTVAHTSALNSPTCCCVITTQATCPHSISKCQRQ